ncbi:hypothetical protein C1S86_24825 [Vibrio parahaemolyticus]|uniref:hypothetical protein n=1 Tax=Vibrio parahaemolyticus TaxID=670 RepID=UPI000991F9DC|nr:hypothetical protein [Vibrio parahaemolyticus]PLR57339.1 hypothetical protein CYU11_12620 [Vibrio parahaemolyticus]PMT73689.1 hypothetical protein C1S97_26315 [Vibrio parahaemolyticus]PMT73803.1 hypothetical protein C1S97_25610 [Vibrio parahaemolyticus]PMT78854.1 hypothetical protein C1S86_25595 [Vibrio parahaemolyticus]PMT78996.1 hypothetical protein C1S86_24825 [Vibrio parahaemolyticus]
MAKNTEAKGTTARPKQYQDASWLEEKHAKLPFFTVIKLAKDSITGFEQPKQRTNFRTKRQLRKRSNTREIAQKLETVNDEVKAKNMHLVPPDRT